MAAKRRRKRAGNDPSNRGGCASPLRGSATFCFGVNPLSGAEGGASHCDTCAHLVSQYQRYDASAGFVLERSLEAAHSMRLDGLSEGTWWRCGRPGFRIVQNPRSTPCCCRSWLRKKLALPTGTTSPRTSRLGLFASCTAANVFRDGFRGGETEQPGCRCECPDRRDLDDAIGLGGMNVACVCGCRVIRRNVHRRLVRRRSSGGRLRSRSRAGCRPLRGL